MNDGTITRMFLTTAVLAAVAALLAGPANAYLVDVEGGVLVTDVAAPTVESQGAATGYELDPAIRTALEARQSGAGSVEASTGRSLGLTGDSPLGRVSAPEPEGLTGDGALTRGDFSSPSVAAASSGDEFDWSWVGIGAGTAALLAALALGLLATSRHRGRVALP